MQSNARTAALTLTLLTWGVLAENTAAQGDTPFPGQTLFQPFFETSTLLLDLNGDVIHSWPGTARPAAAVYYLGDGEVLRTQSLAGSPITSEQFQIVGWDGSIKWTYDFTGPDFDAHHDVEPLPNGNLLIVAWDYHSADEAFAAGRDPALLPGDVFSPEWILEVQPTFPSGGVIVWEWYLWDHLIQDFDPAAANFGVVADHPELVDINYPPQSTPASGDWVHCNAIDYNAELDQIMISAFFQEELWIIDHSTTTAEAAGHTGGNCGRGGDLLYRWGNPEAYDAGTDADQTLWGTHNTHWIPAGQPGAGNILLFNNGFDRPAGEYSSVDEFVPPLEAGGCYTHAPGTAFGPPAVSWSYVAPTPTDLYTPFMGGAERLSNGNTLIVDADDGFLFEVTDDGDTVWEYTSPFPGGGVDPRIFRASRHQICLRPEVFCVAAPNSVGPGAAIGFSGSLSASANDLVLRADGAPPAQPGLFFYGNGAGQVPFGDGFRCVTGETVRLLPAGNVDPAGSFTYALDLSGPASTGGGIEAGSHWNFQLWYRDPAAGGAGFNLSDALSATFCP